MAPGNYAEVKVVALFCHAGKPSMLAAGEKPDSCFCPKTASPLSTNQITAAQVKDFFFLNTLLIFMCLNLFIYLQT